jgi:hypothetical protein
MTRRPDSRPDSRPVTRPSYMSGAGGATTCTEISPYAPTDLIAMIVKTFGIVKTF